MVVEILTEALEVLNNGDSWHKNSLASDKHGMAASPRSTEAVKFCSVGAVVRVAYLRGLKPEDRLKCLQVLDGGVVPHGVLHFNDSVSTSFKDVELMFKKAIARASE